MANGLEYPLFNILEEPIKNNIDLLLNEEDGWIPETKICNLYIVRTYLLLNRVCHKLNYYFLPNFHENFTYFYNFIILAAHLIYYHQK